MKNIFVLVSILFLLTYSIVFNSPNLLTYIESSSGLQTVALEDGRSELEFADINNDGYKDLLTVGDHGNPNVNSQEHGIMVYFGNGTGANWNVFQNGTFGYGGIAIGDVNNDGKQDVGYGIHHNYSGGDLGDQIFEVALGDGTGMNWVAWDDSLATHGETWGMFATDFADVDNDGKLELVGIMSYYEMAGEDGNMMPYVPLLVYEYTDTGIKLDSIETQNVNIQVYNKFYGFDYSEKYEFKGNERFENELNKYK